MRTACEVKRDLLRSKARLIVIFGIGFVLITTVDSLKSNYREHGRARSWLSLVETPALVSSAADVTKLKIDISCQLL